MTLGFMFNNIKQLFENYFSNVEKIESQYLYQSIKKITNLDELLSDTKSIKKEKYYEIKPIEIYKIGEECYLESSRLYISGLSEKEKSVKKYQSKKRKKISERRIKRRAKKKKKNNNNKELEFLVIDGQFQKEIDEASESYSVIEKWYRGDIYKLLVEDFRGYSIYSNDEDNGTKLKSKNLFKKYLK